MSFQGKETNLWHNFRVFLKREGENYFMNVENTRNERGNLSGEGFVLSRKLEMLRGKRRVSRKGEKMDSIEEETRRRD